MITLTLIVREKAIIDQITLDFDVCYYLIGINYFTDYIIADN